MPRLTVWGYVTTFGVVLLPILAILAVIVLVNLIAPESTPEPATAQIVCEAAPPLLPSFEACFTK